MRYDAGCNPRVKTETTIVSQRKTGGARARLCCQMNRAGGTDCACKGASWPCSAMSGNKTASTGGSPNEKACVTQNGQCSKWLPEYGSGLLGVCVSGDCSPSNRAAGRCCNPLAVHNSSHPDAGIVCPYTARETDGASDASSMAKIASHANDLRIFLLLVIAPMGRNSTSSQTDTLPHGRLFSLLQKLVINIQCCTRDRSLDTDLFIMHQNRCHNKHGRRAGEVGLHSAKSLGSKEAQTALDLFSHTVNIFLTSWSLYFVSSTFSLLRAAEQYFVNARTISFFLSAS